MIRDFAIEEMQIPGLMRVIPFVAYDERGYFLKAYSQELRRALELKYELKETLYSYNARKGILRGMHFQMKKPQAKLVCCLSGSIFDVVVDLRHDSKTFGKWQGFLLSQENKIELFIPGGCAHGYLALEPALVSYACDEDYHALYDTGVKWDDADLKIEWPLAKGEAPLLSERDKGLPSFRAYVSGVR